MHKHLGGALLALLATSACVWAADWPSTGGNPQRDGWSQGDTLFSLEGVKQVKQLWTYRVQNASSGVVALTNPIVLSRLIGYHGFEELVMMNGTTGAFAVDADLGRLYFDTSFLPLATTAASQPSTLLCPGGTTSSMVMFGSSTTSRFGGFGGANPIGRLAAYYSVSADGYVRTLRAQDGQDAMIPPAKLVPAGSNVTGLNFAGDTLYAATINGCGGQPNGLYAGTFTPPVLPPRPGMPMTKPSHWAVASFLTNGAGFSGTGGVAAGTKNDIMYGSVPSGKGEVAGTYRDTVLALKASSLGVADWFTPEDAAPPPAASLPITGITPAVFASGGKDYVIAGGRNGRIYILDGKSLGGPDHHTPLYESAPIVAATAQAEGRGMFGTFATCVQDGQRWLYVAIRGPLAITLPDGAATARNGSVVAFKLSMDGAHPTLTPVWASRDLEAPMAPAAANGLVFALSSGMPTRVGKGSGTLMTASELEHEAKPATLYLLNGTTGQELFSSGSDAKSFSSSGLAVANGHVYFSTHDNILYAYGVPEVR